MRRWIDRGPKWIKREPVPHVPYRRNPQEALEYKGAPEATERWIDRARRRQEADLGHDR